MYLYKKEDICLIMHLSKQFKKLNFSIMFYRYIKTFKSVSIILLSIFLQKINKKIKMFFFK